MNCEQAYCSRDTALKRTGDASMKADHVTGAWFRQYQIVDGAARGANGEGESPAVLHQFECAVYIVDFSLTSS